MLVSAASRNDYVASQTSGDEDGSEETTLNQDESNMLKTLQENTTPIEPKENNQSESFFGDMFNRVKSNTNQDELALAGSTIL